MALWQFDVRFVPRMTLLQAFGELPSILPEQSDWDIWWEGVEVHDELFDEIGGGWSIHRQCADYLAWGSDQGDRLEVYRTSDGLSGILARIDVRRVDDAFVRHICRVADRLGCLLMLRD